jgi:hypothetical protein
MASLLIKDIPPILHKRLKAQALQNRRSMAQQVLVFLEDGIRRGLPHPLPHPLKTRRKITAHMIRKGILEGRE